MPALSILIYKLMLWQDVLHSNSKLHRKVCLSHQHTLWITCRLSLVHLSLRLASPGVKKRKRHEHVEMITVAHELEFIFEMFFLFTLKLESLWIATF